MRAEATTNQVNFAADWRASGRAHAAAGAMAQHLSPNDRELPSRHRRSSGLSASGHNSRLSALDLREGADRRGKIADQAAKMAKQLQEVLTKNHVQHQNLRGEEHSAKSQLEQVKGDLESAEVGLARPRRAARPCVHCAWPEYSCALLADSAGRARSVAGRARSRKSRACARKGTPGHNPRARAAIVYADDSRDCSLEITDRRAE